MKLKKFNILLLTTFIFLFSVIAIMTLTGTLALNRIRTNYEKTYENIKEDEMLQIELTELTESKMNLIMNELKAQSEKIYQEARVSSKRYLIDLILISFLLSVLALYIMHYIRKKLLIVISIEEITEQNKID